MGSNVNYGCVIFSTLLKNSTKLLKSVLKLLQKTLNLKSSRWLRGRWTVTLLEKAVGKLVDKLGLDVELGWLRRIAFICGTSMKPN
jgi:hypothetical protein